VVTVDTEVPTIVPKEQRKKAADQAQFDKDMREVDNQIEHLRNKIVRIYARLIFLRKTSAIRRESSLTEVK
jgi:hypothetical protein